MQTEWERHCLHMQEYPVFSFLFCFFFLHGMTLLLLLESLVKLTADDILDFFSLFPESRLWNIIQTVSFGEETLCMKCQSLFSEKSKGEYFKMSSSEFTQRVLKAKALSDIVDGILFVLQCILIFQRR